MKIYILPFRIITLFLLVSITGKSQSRDSQIEFVNLFSADMKEGVSCYRIPSLITAKNGDLIAAIDERVESCADLNKNKDINIVTRRSEDNGTTWSEMQTLVDYPFGQSASDPSMILDNITGEIFLFFNYMNLDTEQGVYYLKYIKSQDNGRTWSAPVDITSQISKPDRKNDFKFITSGRGIQTSKGALIHTLVNVEQGLHLFKSEDHGKSWQLIDTALIPGDESKVVELSDGSLMINSRVSDLGARYIHIISDKGEILSSFPDAQLIDPACNASFIRYTSVKEGSDKNRLLFSNAKSSKDRMNMSVRISYDEGKTWSEGKTLYAGESAYSSLTILQNGDIGLFFEKDDHRENVFVRFTLDWLTEGKDKLIQENQKQK